MKLDDVLARKDSLWRYYPDLFAQKVSRGNWLPYEYLVKIADKIQEKVSNPDGKILLVEAPVRHGKSEFISVHIPPWFLELYPEKFVMHASYSASLSNNFGRRVRNIVKDNSQLLSYSLSADSKSASNWHTNKGGGMICAGVGGSINGRGGHLMIIDDAVKNWQEANSKAIQKRNADWFDSTFYTRREPGAVIVVLMTRWHKKDLAGHIEANYPHEKLTFRALAEEDDSLGRSLGEALCPERYSAAELNATKKNIGSRAFNALYQQKPTSDEDAIVKRSQIKFYGHPECEIKMGPRAILLNSKVKLMSWDMAFKETKSSDFVVGQAWAKMNAEFFLLDQTRARMGFVDTIAAFKLFVLKWPTIIRKLVEDKANGTAVIDSLKKQISGIVPISPKDSKESRLNAVSPLFEAGNVYFPHPSIAPWVPDLVEELVGFGTEEHDDQVDALSQALNELADPAGYSLDKMVK